MDYPITTPGRGFPLGATIERHGINFSVYSKDSIGMELLLFDSPDSAAPSTVIELDPQVNKTYYYWHVFVPHLKAGQVYGYRAHGPYDPERGLRFDNEKLLLDPYGRAVWVPDNYDRGAACVRGDNTAVAMRSVVVDTCDYDWAHDVRPRTPWSKTVIYEMHVAGFTRNPNSGLPADKRGTYAGLVEKIPYLVELGVTAVELLPVFQYDELDAPLGMKNYWGYSPISFFAPHMAYSSVGEPLACVREFRDMVKALHSAGIEVILDVVYNHTAEGNHEGPTLCYRGFANSEYYTLEPDKQYYSNYSGTGNTFNGNRSIARRMIIDSLRYWVNEMHVDGFRFDLASILSRDNDGKPLPDSPVLWDIETDPALAGVKLIAEAWDAGGLYQVGNFVGDAWKEWNGLFRDDVREFVAGCPGALSRLPDRLLASPDVYGHERREPEQSVNFVTAHDGFTMNDLVSYNEKHNEANGENNQDGESHNRSWNCGAEGVTKDPEIEALRLRQIKNFFTLTLFAMGTPMFLMGDEVRRTQLGNNNAFCQDNELSWLDWDEVKKHQDLFRFVQQLIRRRLHKVDRPGEELQPLTEVLRRCKIAWHSPTLFTPDWGEDSRCLAFTVMAQDNSNLVHFMANTGDDAIAFELPLGDRKWLRVIDTFLPSPDDIALDEEAPEVEGNEYLVQGRSIVVLEVRGADEQMIF